MPADFYAKKTAYSFYPSGTTRTEIDMRLELERMFDGYNTEIPKAQTHLLRTMRRDEEDKLIPCACVDSVGGEPDRDRFCPLCYGEGFYWDEKEIQIYRTVVSSRSVPFQEDQIAPGLLNLSTMVFYCRYEDKIHRQDKIVLYKHDSTGEVLMPKEREYFYHIVFPHELRSDYGRLEYWALYAREVNPKWKNQPLYRKV